MIKDAPSFSSYSVSDVNEAKHFYGDIVGVPCAERPEGLELKLNGGRVFLYPKSDHAPATFTVLNFKVADIDAEVDELAERSVHLERYPGMHPDGKGICWNDGRTPGPRAIGWFKDPAGNILAVIQEK